MPRPFLRVVDGWPAAAIISGVLLTLLVPPSLLDNLGLGYSTASGAAWEKVHPGSDLILLGFGAAALSSGTPWDWMRDRLRRFAGSLVFLVTIAFLTLYIITVQHAPFTPLIDTFLVPVILFIALVDFDDTWQGRLEGLLHGFLAVNALLGIGEYLTGWRLIPVEVGGLDQVAATEARAFGLLGHPLASAAMAGLYAVVLMLGGGRRLPASCRIPALGLQLIALAAFGGRTALIMTLACLAGTAAVCMFRVLAGREVDLRRCGVALLLSPLAFAALAALAGSGFFDVILERFVNDKGSAAARQVIFDLFGYISLGDLLLGPDQEQLAGLLHLVGIEVGVESFWLGFLFFYGLLPSLVFFLGLGCFTVDLMRRTQGTACVPLLFFVGIISTSISLSAKTTMLGQFVAVLVTLMPKAGLRPAASITRPPRTVWATA